MQYPCEEADAKQYIVIRILAHSNMYVNILFKNSIDIIDIFDIINCVKEMFYHVMDG